MSISSHFIVTIRESAFASQTIPIESIARTSVELRDYLTLGVLSSSLANHGY